MAGVKGTAPSPFYGYSQVDGTALTINSIGYLNAHAGQKAPFSLKCYPNVTTAGARRLSAAAINDYEHVEYRWTVTYSDDSAVEYNDEITNPITSVAANPYTDTISPEGTFLLRKAGTYKIILDARLMASDGQTYHDTFTDTVTIADNTQTHKFYDPVSGNDANDGLDPNGFALTAGVYTESTGVLTETGAFTGWTPDGLTYEQDSGDWIYITGFGLTKIASKTDNNTVVIDDNYKLGSDQTGLASSDGAKQNWNGTGVSGEFTHLLGGQTYDVTVKWDIANKALPMSLGAYGTSSATVISSTLGATELIDTGLNGASHTGPDKICIHRIIANCQGVQTVGFQGTYTSTNEPNYQDLLYDRIETKNGVALSGLSMTHWMNVGVHMHASIVSSLKQASESKRFGIYSNLATGSDFRATGLIIDADCDNSTLDHYFYPDGYDDHIHMGWYYTRAGTGANFALNFNTAKNQGVYERNFVSIHDSYFTSCVNGIDLSNHNNNPDLQTFKDVHIARNKALVDGSFLYYFGCKSLFAIDNEHTTQTPETFKWFHQHGVAGGFEAAYDAVESQYSAVLERNKHYGNGFSGVSRGLAIELYDNSSYNTLTATWNVIWRPALTTGAQEAKDNNFYSPNDSDGDVFSVDSTAYALAGFNTLIGNTNTEANPSWIDPANGVFDPTDTTAPVLSLPTGVQTGATTATGTATTDEDSGTLYFIATENATELEAAIRAGSSQAISGTGSQAVAFTGLTQSTLYYAHYIQEDAAANVSNVINSTGFTTEATVTNLFSDDFNRANESLDASADWTERDGNYQIVSNYAELTGSGGTNRCAHIASSHVTTADYSVTSNLDKGTAILYGYHGICGRRVDYSTADSDMYVMIYSPSDDLKLYKRISGSWTQLDTYSVTLTNNTSYKFELKMNGTTIEGYLDDVLRLSATDSSLTASGDAGIQNGTDSSADAGRRWNDFSVDTIGAADTVAPVLTSPAGASTGSTTASGSVSTDEGNGTLYQVTTTSGTAPSVAQIKLGQDNTGTAAAYSSNQAISSTGTKNISATGLAAETAYYNHFQHVDAAANDSTVVSSALFTTDDVTAPVLSLPTGTKTGSSTASGTVTTDEGNGTLYFLASTNATELVATIKAGSNQAVSATGSQAVVFSGLTPETIYYAHYVQDDVATNTSNLVHSTSFTTDAIPVSTSTWSDNNSSRILGKTGLTNSPFTSRKY